MHQVRLLTFYFFSFLSDSTSVSTSHFLLSYLSNTLCHLWQITFTKAFNCLWAGRKFVKELLLTARAKRTGHCWRSVAHSRSLCDRCNSSPAHFSCFLPTFGCHFETHLGTCHRHKQDHLLFSGWGTVGIKATRQMLTKVLAIDAVATNELNNVSQCHNRKSNSPKD